MPGLVEEPTARPDPDPRGRAVRLEAGLLTTALFVVYAAGACPTIYVGDSGELVTAVHLLGIPHPSGSPLYVLLGKAWTLLLPVGSIAWRMSVFSAACAALACGVVYALCRRVPLQPVAAAVSALLLAFAPSFWGEANIQRVYGLEALFVALATAAAWRWHRERDDRSLVGAFFLCGLGATVHLFLAVFAIALALVAAPAVWRRPRLVAVAGGAFVLGLVPYVYLPLRARMHPVLDWGDPETLQRFVNVVLRRDFWPRRWIEGPADVPVIVADHLWSLVVELAWGGAALALLGLLVGRRRGWPVLLPLLVIVGNVAVMAAHGSRTDLFVWHRYYIPSYAMAAILAGLGTHALLERLPRALRPLPLILPLALLATGWTTFDRSHYRIAEDFSRAVLRSLPPGAHLAATDDNVLFVLMYLHLVEDVRPDVDLILQGVGQADLPPLRFDPDTDPLFLTHHPNWRNPALAIRPVGLVFRACRADQPPPPPVVPLRALDGERDPRVPKDYLTQNLIGHFHYMLGVTAEERDWPGAAREFAAATAAAPDNDVLFYNLGLIYERDGLFDDAVAAFARSNAINPRHIASHQHAVAAERLARARREQDRLARIEQEVVADPRVAATAPGTRARHERIADLLDARGEHVAARGHRLRAQVVS